MRKILVDGRTFVKTSAGISTFLKGSLFEWARQCPNDMFWLYIPKNVDSTTDIQELPSNIHLVVNKNRLLKRLPNLFILLFAIPLLCRKLSIDIFYSPVPFIPFFLSSKTRKLIVVHDVVNLEYQDTMEFRNKISNALFFRRSIRIADYIWTNSYYTRNMVEKYIPIRKCQNIFTGCSIDREIYKPLNLSQAKVSEIKNKHNIKNRFILFVGSLEPRKNLEFLIRIAPKLYHERNIQLVIVGGRGWKNSKISNIVEAPSFPKESTIFCGYVSNQELAELYNCADAFVSASFNEGFGMPQLEATFCGCPVITAHNSAMVEVIDGVEGSLSIRGYDPQLWCESIYKVVYGNYRVSSQRVERYNWVTIIKEFLTTYISHAI